KLPDDWKPALKLVHEIWVPSQFTRDAVAASTNLPVHVLPHPLPEVTVAPGGRSQWGLPENAVVVLNVFHLGSAFSRKNPLASVNAFRRAFGDAPDRILVIKLIDHGAAPAARRELEDAIAGATNIRIIDRTLPSSEMAALMAASDIVISL